MASLTDTLLDRLIPELVAARHDIHKHPELGFEEFRTQSKVIEWLSARGYEPRKLASTGVVADLHAEHRPGRPTVALRADMDCLPIHEETPLPYRSIHAGQSHKCGHDGHTAILMGVAAILAERRDELDLNVRLIFQPAEEGVDGGGAKRMVAEGVLEGVDEIYGLHNWPGYPAGCLRVIAGTIMAEVDDFDIRVIGRGGHASQPQVCSDPVVASADLIMSLQTLVSRNVGALGGAVISVCQVHGGEARNAIPEDVKMSGTMRLFDDALGEALRRRMHEVAQGVAQTHGVEVELEVVRGYPVLVNDSKCVDTVRRAGAKVLGEDAVSSDELPMAGGEDFAFFAAAKPAAYFFLGSGRPGENTPGCHHPDFDFDDELIPVGVRMFMAIVDERAGA